ncbi:hypothetical protein D0962_11045 [Leptolyngbyaceae cyanobacterium CCMR0082]|uniref:Uncharacterized protein n=2 Tax=Adonisia turfae TaxID=2950184 RepID=A0A6M0S485_9CYAN|nr:hypothetical protein [Adonisia turfae]MDV3350463.1 hypothetical protein [Leptothoe sp. LEGE 181152]NEZ55705.1 hypothetical protein [Adonisia turfae CCMR0081]NEZ63314.1 hypothetical protein [Adonisia turfae CCMR0082]
MNIKLIISNAVLGTLTLALAGYAQSNVSNNSRHLSDIQAQTCPVFLTDSTSADISRNQRLAVPVRPNEVLDLTLLCYSGPVDTAASERLNTEVNNRPSETPQSATQFDQLPQDRVEFGSPI